MDSCQFEVSPGMLCGRRGKLLRLSAAGDPNPSYQSRCYEHSKAERQEAYRKQQELAARAKR